MDKKHTSDNDGSELEACRKELQEAQRSLRMLRSITDSSPAVVCLWRVGDDWPIEFISDGIGQFGHTPEELLSGKVSYRDFILPEDMARLEAEVARNFEQGVDKYTQEYRIAAKSGEIRWVEDRNIVIRDSNGQVTHVQGMILDITERKQSEELLGQSEQRYRALFEGANEGILVADIETRKQMFANPTACRMLKYTIEELLEMSAEDLHRPEDVTHVMTEFQALVREDHRIAPTIPFLTKDGEIVYADVAAAIIRLEGRDCLVGFLRDLTEARRAEEALKTAHMKLVTARDEERKYLAAELHDSVNQKLVALGMLLNNVALTGAKLPAEPGYELLKAAVTCNELIADIRGICHGLYPPALEALGLVSAMKQLEGHGQTAGLTAAMHCDPAIARTRFTPEVEIALFRIAQEAVNNAIRHSRGTNIDIDLVYTDGQLVLAVIDDGGGFDVQAAAGAGLGLSSIRDRALAVGAKLTIASEPGETRVEVAVKMNLEETDGKKG